MAAQALQLDGTCVPWREVARTGTWDDGARELPVWVIPGPVSPPESLGRAVGAAAPWIGRERPGVHPLLAVIRAEGRNMWVYPRCDGVGLGHLAGDGDALPVRAAAEIVARLAACLHDVELADTHPGPLPEDVLVRPSGEVLVTGFVGPAPRPPSRRAPGGDEGPPALVYRLGVLLAELLDGAPPASSSDPQGHQAALRRTLIRVMSRPGPVFPERCRDWLTAMLAWDAAQRPVLPQISTGLVDAVDALPGPALDTWARDSLPSLRARLLADAASSLDEAPAPPPDIPLGTVVVEPTEELPPEAPPGTRTLDRIEHDLPVVDEPTAVSATGAQPWIGPSERGAMPVQVGPPPEAVPRPATLPEELFSEDDDEAPAAAAPTGPRLPWLPGAGLLVVVSIALVLMGIALLVYLL